MSNNLQDLATLLDLIGRTDEEQIKLPNDIETSEDFVAWCRNADHYPFSEEDIRLALGKIEVDQEGRIKENLKTASRTFFKGHKREDILNWISDAFDDKNS